MSLIEAIDAARSRTELEQLYPDAQLREDTMLRYQRRKRELEPEPDLLSHRSPMSQRPRPEDDWEDVPLPQALTQYPPPLGEHALVGLVGDISRATVELTGCDPLSPVVHLIGAFGVVTPSNVREAALMQPAREFVLPVGRTGGTRKGTVQAAIHRLLRYVDRGVGERTIAWQGGSGEGLFARLSDSPSALVFADEFGQILAQAQRSGQTVLAAFRSLWNPEGDAEIATRRDPVCIRGAHVSAVFHTTPDEAQNGFRAGEVTTGLVNRLLVARLRRAEYRAFTADYPSDVFEELTAKLSSSVASMSSRTADIVDYTPDAIALWKATKPMLEDREDAPGADILARGAGHVTRVALIYALIEGHDEIEESDLRAALAVWDACRSSALLLFGSMTGDLGADRIYAVLTQYGGRMNRTQLRDALGRHGHRADTENSLVTLASRGLIRRRQRKTGGRPEEVIDVLDLSGRGVRDISAESDITPEGVSR